MMQTSPLFRGVVDRWLVRAVLVLTLLLASGASAQAQTLRWQLSPSSGVIGYVLYVGDAPGFFEAGAGTPYDIGDSFVLENGVAEFPIGALVPTNAFVVMTAYDGNGVESVPSNELFVPFIPGGGDSQIECGTDAECSDGNLCNGTESCSNGLCVASEPLACGAAGPCQIGRCDPVFGCAVDNAPDGAICSDDNPLTVGDACLQGVCVGTAPPTQDDSVPEGVLYAANFSQYAEGEDPVGWLDTGSLNRMHEAPKMFSTHVMADGNVVLRSTADLRNIHSHVVQPDSSAWSNYELVGRMQVANMEAGVGVTVYSDYRDSDAYFRLLKPSGSQDFRLSHHPVGSATCSGDSSTGVIPQPGTWYRFRFSARPTSGGTRLRAKVWADGFQEPGSWQADCIAGGRSGGRIGVWSGGSGERYWDDLEVRVDEADLPDLPVPECTTSAQCSDGNACNGAESCVAGACVPGAPPVCSASSGCMDGFCDPAVGCVEVPADGRACDDGNACTVGDVCGGGSCQAGAPRVCLGGSDCSDVSCDPAVGCVEVLANGRSCDDGNACTLGDVCQAGGCVPGIGASCPQPTQCQVGFCDPIAGCQLDNLPDGTPCDDGSLGTVDDLCGAGVCLGVAVEPQPPVDDEPDGDGEPMPGDGTVVMLEDFQLYVADQDPFGWFDTGELELDVPQVEQPGLFRTDQLDGNVVFATSSASGANSHFVVSGSEGWGGYAYLGRMRIEDPSAGIGVTMHAKVPGSGRHLGLRSQAGTFRLASLGTGSCTGATDTGIAPAPGFWYGFRFATRLEGDQLRLLARVWREDELEPEAWQIDCSILATQAPKFGRVGVWAAGGGLKYWDDLTVVSGSPKTMEVLYQDDFEEYSNGEMADGWLETGPDSSLAETPGLFDTRRLDDGNVVLRTRSRGSNVHAHLISPDGADWRDYELEGRMRVTDARGGIGVTVLSAFPSSDAYFRLRTYDGDDFELSHHPHGDVSCLGGTRTGVFPEAWTWFRFRFDATSVENGTRLRAKVWRDGTPEPSGYQTECTVRGGRSAGRIGVWSHGPGAKTWDDLRVRRYVPEPSSVSAASARAPQEGGDSLPPVGTTPQEPTPEDQALVEEAEALLDQLNQVLFALYGTDATPLELTP